MEICLQQLRQDLTENLQKHVRNQRPSASAQVGISLQEYEERERHIKEKYTLLHVDMDTIERLQREVDASVFANSRNNVEKCFNDLAGSEHAQYHACRTLVWELFVYIYDRMSYDAADWFASLGGVPRLMLLLQETYTKFRSSNWNDHQAGRLCTEALKAMKSFANSNERISLAYNHQFLDMLVEIMCESKAEVLQRECAKAIISFLDDKVWQVKIVYAGALQPLLDMALNPMTPLDTVDDAVAGIMSCAVNSAVYDVMIKNNVAGRLNHLAQNVYKMHRNEILTKVFMHQGNNIVDSLALHVSYLCYVGVSLLFHQRCRQHWLSIVDKIREQGRPNDYDDLADLVEAMPLANADKQKLKAVRSFTSETDPSKVRVVEDNRYIWPVYTPFTCLLQSSYPEVREMGAFSLVNLCQGAENCDALRADEDSSGVELLQLTAACTGREKESADYTCRMCTQALTLVTRGSVVKPPKLETICSFYISKHFYKQFSLTALQHLPLNLLKNLLPFELV